MEGIPFYRHERALEYVSKTYKKERKKEIWNLYLNKDIERANIHTAQKYICLTNKQTVFFFRVNKPPNFTWNLSQTDILSYARVPLKYDGVI